MVKRQERIRFRIQSLVTVILNGNLLGFFKGSIHQGGSKSVCIPGLNCYSCPGALGACPLGSLQSSLADPRLHFPFYVLGTLALFGSIFGRLICGWLCPFGWFQDLLYKVPLFKNFKGKRKREQLMTLAGRRKLEWMRYVILIVFVVFLPILPTFAGSFGSPTFCKWICPAGTIFAGWPLVLTITDLRAMVGWIFTWKSLVALLLILAFTRWRRPFCRYLCPLGAIYGFFNRFSLYRLEVDRSACTNCGRCTAVCPVEAPIPAQPNHRSCIRCKNCVAACPEQAIKSGFCLGRNADKFNT